MGRNKNQAKKDFGKTVLFGVGRAGIGQRAEEGLGWAGAFFGEKKEIFGTIPATNQSQEGNFPPQPQFPLV